MTNVNRRDFLSGVSAGLSAGAAATAASSAFSMNVLGANDRVVLGLMGAGGRGSWLAREFAKRDDVEVRYVADCDRNRAEPLAAELSKSTGRPAKALQDFRHMLDDPRLDAMINATPNHWHALGTILACQAEKDVYVEKPLAHNVFEGQRMIAAKNRYRRVVQVGSQNRSAEYCRQAFERIRQSDFGSFHLVRVMNSKPRRTIGRVKTEPVPKGVDYDMWLGPAAMRPFNRNEFHYNWNWFWDFGAGDISNDGVHQIDIARWMIGQKAPKSVFSTGGVHFFQDDQETPDTHIATFDFDRLTMVFEQALWAPYMRKTPFEMRDTDNLPTWPFSGTRIEIHGSKDIMYLGRHGGGWQIFDRKWNSVDVGPGRFANAEHIENFLDCVRTRKEPNATVEELHLSTNLCHYANISYRLGRRLRIDAERERFVNDDEANTYLTRPYRQPWVVPKEV